MCLFCKIANHEIPAFILHEDERCLAFLDISPLSKGHTLIISKAHRTDFLDAESSIYQPLFDLAHDLGIRLKQKLSCDGFNMVTNIGPAAGQEIAHFHLHLIPRYQGDQLQIMPQANLADQSELKQLFENIIK